VADFLIRLKADNAQLRAQIAQVEADLRRLNAAGSTVNIGGGRGGGGIGGAPGSFGPQTAAQAAASAQRAASAQAAAANQVIAANRRVVESHDAIGTAVLGLAAGYASLSFAKDLIAGLGQASKDAGDHQKGLADEFIRQRDAMREIASMQGKQATSKFTIEQAEFARDAGLTLAEAEKFRNKFAGSAAQYEGRTLSKPEFAQFEKLMAQEASVTGIDPNVIGELGGKTAGFRNFATYGEQAAEVAAGEFHQNFGILMHGSGGNVPLGHEMARTAAQLLSDDETKGAFKSSKDVAVMVSTLAEAGDKNINTAARAAVRGLRAFGEKDEQAPLLRRAGITLEDDTESAARKLAPVVEAERAAGPKGMKTTDVLEKYFKSEQEKNAIAILINRGVEGGLFDERRAYAAQFEGGATSDAEVNAARAAKMQADMQAARTDPNNAQATRRAEAALEVSKAKSAARTVKYEALRTQALADLENPDQPGGKQINTTETNRTDFLMDKISLDYQFGYTEGWKEERIKSRMAEIVAQNAAAAGITFDEREFNRMAVPQSREDSTRAFEEQMGRIADAGLNPVTGERIGAAAPNPGLAAPGAAGPVDVRVVVPNRPAEARVPPPLPPPRPVGAPVGR
jgi:hypothetical protein